MKILRKYHLAQTTLAINAFLMIIMPLTTAFAFSITSIPILSKFAPSQAQSEEVSFNDNSQNTALLAPANHIDPNPAKGGGDINVVEDKALFAENSLSGEVVDINKPENNGQISLYEVRPGDTISQIADMFGVSINTIRWANDLSGEIQPGQSLIILPISGVKHVVKKGGTITDVAKLYDADAREIALFNGLDENATLKPGQEIIVPHAELKQETKKTSSGKVLATGGASKTAITLSKGYFMDPVPGAVLTQGIHGYNGVDLGAPIGTPVYAAAAGSVITSKQGGWNGGYGSMIIISHDNGTQTLYGHLSKNVAYTGQKVSKGDLIGYVGSTGKSTGSHLHFEVRGAKNPINSACVIGKVCNY